MCPSLTCLTSFLVDLFNKQKRKAKSRDIERKSLRRNKFKSLFFVKAETSENIEVPSGLQSFSTVNTLALTFERVAEKLRDLHNQA